MQKVAVNQQGFEYINYLEAEPRMIFEDGVETNVQETSPDQQPMWNITCLAKSKFLPGMTKKPKPETILVKVPMAKKPEIEPHTPVNFVNLVASAFVSSGWGQLSFAAARMEAVEKQGKPRA